MAINYNIRNSFGVFVTAEGSLQIRKAIIDAKKNESGFDLSSLNQTTTFEWLADKVIEFSP